MMKYDNKIKLSSDKRAMLNLACGSKMNWDWNNIDFNYYAILVKYKLIKSLLSRFNLISLSRQKKLNNIDPDIIKWDLQKGLPFSDNKFDVIYNSHFLEHLQNNCTAIFLEECYRVLKPGGILRIVVPNLNSLIEDYVLTYKLITDGNEHLIKQHKENIDNIFEQFVRIDSGSLEERIGILGFIESKILRRSVEKTGELHRWLYDQYTLTDLLSIVGFINIKGYQFNSSGIKGWNKFALDINEKGEEYKKDSLYIEGQKHQI